MICDGFKTTSIDLKLQITISCDQKRLETSGKRKPLNTPEGKSNVPKRAKAKYLFPDQ